MVLNMVWTCLNIAWIGLDCDSSFIAISPGRFLNLALRFAYCIEIYIHIHILYIFFENWPDYTSHTGHLQANEPPCSKVKTLSMFLQKMAIPARIIWGLCTQPVEEWKKHGLLVESSYWWYWDDRVPSTLFQIPYIISIIVGYTVGYIVSWLII